VNLQENFQSQFGGISVVYFIALGSSSLADRLGGETHFSLDEPFIPEFEIFEVL
jgi:hypothetical protein